MSSFKATLSFSYILKSKEEEEKNPEKPLLATWKNNPNGRHDHVVANNTSNNTSRTIAHAPGELMIAGNWWSIHDYR